ncbi:hypothetical protein ABZ746_39340 [Streptomyces sp. NPDC020096]
MARDRSQIEAHGIGRGDRVGGRGGVREVKAVRDRRSARGLDVIVVFKEGRPS